MRMTAQRAFYFPHVEAEYAAHHIIHGIEFGNRKAARRKFAPGQLDGSKRAVMDFPSSRNLPSMHMDATIEREMCGVRPGLTAPQSATPPSK